MIERNVLFLAIAQTLIWAATFYIFAALLLWWEADTGWQRSELTGAFTVALLTSAICSPFVGRLIDRGLGPLVMGLTGAGAGILIGVLSTVTELWQFYLVWFGIGMMISGCLYEPCFAIITRARGPAGRPAIVIITLFAGFASTLSFPLANSIAEDHGWRSALIAFSSLSVFVSAPLMWIGASGIENGSRYETGLNKAKPKKSGRQFIFQGKFWLLGIAFACGSMLQQITINHLLPILHDRGVAMQTAILAAAFIGPMQVAGRIAMVAAGSAASNHVVAILSFSSMAVSIVMLMFAGAGPGFIAAFAIFFGAAHGVVSIVRPGLTWDILGSENYGAKSGTLASLFFVGGAIAPFVGALIWGKGGYDTVLVFLVALAVVGLALYMFAHRLSKLDY